VQDVQVFQTKDKLEATKRLLAGGEKSEKEQKNKSLETNPELNNKQTNK
jgi:hypothetical protein